MDSEMVQTFALIAVAAFTWTISRTLEKLLEELRIIKGAVLGGLFRRESDGAFQYSELAEIRSLLTRHRP